MAENLSAMAAAEFRRDAERRQQGLALDAGSTAAANAHYPGEISIDRGTRGRNMEGT